MRITYNASEMYIERAMDWGGSSWSIRIQTSCKREAGGLRADQHGNVFPPIAALHGFKAGPVQLMHSRRPAQPVISSMQHLMNAWDTEEQTKCRAGCNQ